MLPPSSEQSSAIPPQLKSEIAANLTTDASPVSPSQVSQIATDGLSGSGEPLPQLPTLQQAFGGIDLSSIRVHRGDQAKIATDKLSAQAFTRGEHIALSGQPSLQDLAHETAHVVQQRYASSGLPAGLSDSSHPMEKQADSIANHVAQGGSALPILTALPLSPLGSPTTHSHQLPVMRIKQSNAQQKIQKAKDKQEYLIKCLSRTHNRVAAFEIWQWFMMYTVLDNGQNVYEYYRYSWDKAAQKNNIGPYPDINAKSAQDNDGSNNAKLSNKGGMVSSRIIKNLNKDNSHKVSHSVANLGNKTKDVADLAPVSNKLVQLGHDWIVDPIADKIDQKQRTKYSNEIADDEQDIEEDKDANSQMFDMSTLNDAKPKPKQAEPQFEDLLFNSNVDHLNNNQSDIEEEQTANLQSQFGWTTFDDHDDFDVNGNSSKSSKSQKSDQKNIKSSLLGNEADYVSGLKNSGKKLGNQGIDMILAAPVTIAKQFTKGILTIGKGFGALIESSGKSIEASQLQALAKQAYKEAKAYLDEHEERLFDDSASEELLEALQLLVKYPWGGNAQVILSSAVNSGLSGNEFNQLDSKVQFGVDNAADSEDWLSGNETKTSGFYSEAKKSQNFKGIHKNVQTLKSVFGHASQDKDKIADAVYAGLSSTYQLDKEIAKAILYGPLGHTDETLDQLGLQLSRPGPIAKYIRNVQLSGGD